jgi:hypothetical protein
MIRCQYIYVAGDKKVISGKYKIGDQCTRTSVGDKTHGFCFGHFKKWNKINNPKANSKLSAKQKATMLRHNKKRELKNKDTNAESQGKLDAEAQKLVDVMGLSEEYDLLTEYTICRALNANPTQETFAEKFSFAMWLDTAKDKRTPDTLEEVAKILGVSIMTIHLWKRSPEINRMINDKTREVVSKSYKYVWFKVLEGVSQGDTRSKDIALKHIKEVEDKKEVKNTFPDLPRDVVEQATGTTGKLDNVANQALKIAAYDSLLNGNVKPNDTVQ